MQNLLIIAGILFLAIMLLVIYISKKDKIKRGENKPNNQQKANKSINLSDKVRLKFIKNESRWNRYYIQFYNPYTNSWWYLPDLRAGIHALWSFQKQGSYGAYDVYKYECDYNDIDGCAYRFGTLQNIQNYFDECNKKYIEFQGRQQKNDELPKTIIK